jgi:outer membrane protein assembly factor BamA
LAGLPLGLQGKFDLFRQDTSYLNIGWELGVPYHFGPLNSLNVFIRHKESSIVGITTEVNSRIWQPFTSLISGVAWEMNSLDNQINPFKGLHIRLEAATGRKNIPDSVSVQQSEFSAKIFWFQPLARNFTCSLGLQSGYRITPETYENEQYRLGGLNLLRGFDEDVFFTNLFAVSSIEFRYLLDKSSHLLLLSDLGFLRANEKNNLVIKMPVGFGLGGQIRTSGGIFRIIFALGKQSGEVINLKNSKIHLGYVGVF